MSRSIARSTHAILVTSRTKPCHLYLRSPVKDRTSTSLFKGRAWTQRSIRWMCECWLEQWWYTYIADHVWFGISRLKADLRKSTICCPVWRSVQESCTINEVSSCLTIIRTNICRYWARLVLNWFFRWNYVKYISRVFVILIWSRQHCGKIIYLLGIVYYVKLLLNFGPSPLHNSAVCTYVIRLYWYCLVCYISRYIDCLFWRNILYLWSFLLWAPISEFVLI